MKKVFYFGMKYSLCVTTLTLTACGGGSSSSPTPIPSPTIIPTQPLQAFATIINNEINLLQNSGTYSNPIIPGLVAFPNATSANPEAYLLAYNGQFIHTDTQSPAGGYMAYLNPDLYTYANSDWTVTPLEFPSESTVVTNMVVSNNSVFMVAESYTRISNSTENKVIYNVPQLYEYSNESLNNLSNNPYTTNCNISCNMTSLATTGNNVIYVAGWNDNGTQIYSYDGTTWNNLLNQPLIQLTITSLAVDNNNTLYALGYSSAPNKNGSPYLASYNSGKWRVLANANAGVITFNGTNLYSLITTTNNNNPYSLYSLVSSQWNHIGDLSQSIAFGLTFNQLVSDQYGNIYVNAFENQIHDEAVWIDHPTTQLVFSN